jgi:hypothetical protein
MLELSTCEEERDMHGSVMFHKLVVLQSQPRTQHVLRLAQPRLFDRCLSCIAMQRAGAANVGAVLCFDACAFLHYRRPAFCSVLELPTCEEERDMHGNLMFRGPRVKMGIYCGTPTRVIPHTTTGRADYFGPVVSAIE